MNNNFVAYSRAGDMFHYRWAARRCVKMLYPNSLIDKIVIEGSDESFTKNPEGKKIPSEYVIDVTEYSHSLNDEEIIRYYQLKHSTVQTNNKLLLSDLKKTISGFAKRYLEHLSSLEIEKQITVKFYLITNRLVCENLKNNISNVVNNFDTNTRFLSTITKYTNLSVDDLRIFLSKLTIIDYENNYLGQEINLRRELSLLVAGHIESSTIDSIVSLVQKKLLPDSDSIIIKEDVLNIFGISSEDELFPAPNEYRINTDIIERKHYIELKQQILESEQPIIIHANGGVGKSIFSQYIKMSLPINSLGIVYDCFGGGKYRNRSRSRHDHKRAYTQIINELASYNLCDPIIPINNISPVDTSSKLIKSIEKSVLALREKDKSANLLIIIDAADNAIMASEEFNESCFVNDLLNENLPSGCKLVTLCRSERIDLLNCTEGFNIIELKSFNEQESLIHLQTKYPDAIYEEGVEFHKLTNSGNPRLQSYILDLNYNSKEEALESISPNGVTLESQFSNTLDTAIHRIKKHLPKNYQDKINSICMCMANLPPNIPISVLSAVSGVNIAYVKSFINDFGVYINIFNDSMQFRDEPTETWFRDKYPGTISLFNSFLDKLLPISNSNTYVAEVLPIILLKAEKYDYLIEITLSNQYLPDNLIEARSVRLNRLHFACKAALKQNKYYDAIKIAMLAGEETAGTQRQNNVFINDIDLVTHLLGKDKIQDLAYNRKLKSNWLGSDNLFSAALLSPIENLIGEARIYYKTAIKWLLRNFEDGRDSSNVSDEDISALVWTEYNLFGIKNAIRSILGWSPNHVIYRTSKEFVKKLIDYELYSDIDVLLNYKSFKTIDTFQYLFLATVHELQKINYPINKSFCKIYLDYLYKDKTNKLDNIPHIDGINLSLLSFLEYCFINGQSKLKILQVLDIYLPQKVNYNFTDAYFSKDRELFLRSKALKYLIKGIINPDIELIVNSIKENYGHEREIKLIISILLPYEITRLRAFVSNNFNLESHIKLLEKNYITIINNNYFTDSFITSEKNKILFDFMVFEKEYTSKQIQALYNKFLKNKHNLSINNLLNVLRISNRVPKLCDIKKDLEQYTFKAINKVKGESPESYSKWYIELSRAILPNDINDAIEYFNLAIEVISKFGDEIVIRWEAIVALATRASEFQDNNDEIAYNFLRCAELVGDNVLEEKYWDRNEAIITASKLSPPIAIATLSRWRDRDVGTFNKQVYALSEELVISKYISPKVGWCLSALMDKGYLIDYAKTCLINETNPDNRIIILESLVRTISLSITEYEEWEQLRELASCFNYSSNIINEYFKIHKTPINKYQNTLLNKEKIPNWDDIFNNGNTFVIENLNQSITNYYKFNNNEYLDNNFWVELIKRVDSRNLIELFENLIQINKLSLNNFITIIKLISSDLLLKPSIKRWWPTYLRKLSEIYAFQLSSIHKINYYFETVQKELIDIDNIKAGVIKGLIDNLDISGAETLFSLIGIIADHISPSEANKLVIWATHRFNKYIENDYADGEWSPWLNPSNNGIGAITGIIYSCLGSPRSEIRWKSVHIVRLLARMNCDEEINELINLLNGRIQYSFNCKNFPFYSLHAKLFLLIALYTVSYEKPEILINYSNTFQNIALNDIKHVLVQHYAKSIALELEKYSRNTYNRETLIKLSEINVTPSILDSNNKKQSKSKLNTPNQDDGKFNFGWDFDRYWHQPLGDVFGLSEDTIKHMSVNIIHNDWGIKNNGDYERDPRVDIWRKTYYERETWHDHGNYPKTDRYNFYLSYHALFEVASKLIEKFPIENCEYNNWEDWLKRHLITCSNGYLLSDFRNEFPIKYYKSTLCENNSNDLLNIIFDTNFNVNYLNVFGTIENINYNNSETIYISSSLVPNTTSKALLLSLSKNKPPYFDFYSIKQSFHDSINNNFNLSKWIQRNSEDKGIDEFDPLASEINYPSYTINEKIKNDFNFTYNKDKKSWYLNNHDNPSFISKLWSNDKYYYNRESVSNGNTICVSEDFLKTLCKKYKHDLILRVKVYNHKKSYARGKDEDTEFERFFLFTKEGKFRDRKYYYKIRR